MPNPREIHDMEQAEAAIREHLVPALASFFNALIEQNFTRAEALALTELYLTELWRGTASSGSQQMEF